MRPSETLPSKVPEKIMGQICFIFTVAGIFTEEENTDKGTSAADIEGGSS